MGYICPYLQAKKKTECYQGISVPSERLDLTALSECLILFVFFK